MKMKRVKICLKNLTGKYINPAFPILHENIFFLLSSS